MSERDLEARLDAVERALTDGETDLAGLEEAADHAAEIERLDERVDSLESRVADLDAAVQAVRGYVGNLRAVNRDVERRASAALAKAETLETAVEDVTGDHAGSNLTRGPATVSDSDRGPGTETEAESDPDPGPTVDTDPTGERGTRSDPARGPGTGDGAESVSAHTPDFAAASRPSADRSSADRLERDDRGPERPSKYGRDSAREADEKADARSDRGYAVGDVGGPHPDSERPGRTSQFIERVRDVL